MRAQNAKNTWKTADLLNITAVKNGHGKNARRFFLLQGYDPRNAEKTRIRK